MLKKISKTRIVFFAAIFIGVTGVIGQSYLLHHELVECYPYKMMDSNFYESIASFGIYFAPIVAIIGGLLFGLKRFWLAAIVPVVLCPLVFSAVFKVSSFLRSEMSGIENATWHFDGKTPAMAAQEFFLYTLTLSFVGLIIGGICSFIIYQFSNKKKLP